MRMALKPCFLQEFLPIVITVTWDYVRLLYSLGAMASAIRGAIPSS
jgi:hypothetical protein